MQLVLLVLLVFVMGVSVAFSTHRPHGRCRRSRARARRACLSRRGPVGRRGCAGQSGRAQLRQPGAKPPRPPAPAPAAGASRAPDFPPRHPGWPSFARSPCRSMAWCTAAGFTTDAPAAGARGCYYRMFAAAPLRRSSSRSSLSPSPAASRQSAECR